MAVFAVSVVKTFPKHRFPTQRVYGDLSHAGLRLITCDGFDEESSSYEENLVVFARLVSVRGP